MSDKLDFDFVKDSMEAFAKKEQNALCEEIVRLSNEGHLQVVSVEKYIKQESPTNFLTINVGLFLRMPKYDKAVEALKDAERELRWHAEKWNEESFGNRLEGRSGNAYKAAENINKTLKELGEG